MRKLCIPDAYAGKTIEKRCPAFSRYIDKRIDSLSPLGIWYSEMHRRVENPAFRRMEKANKKRRGQMFSMGYIDSTDLRIKQFAMSLLGRNCVIMDMEKIEYLKAKVLGLLLKWPGGKTSDLKYLRSNLAHVFPKKIEKYYEPFLGGGAVWLAIDNHSMFVNDICDDLIDFYNYIKRGDESFFGYIKKMDAAWTVLHSIAADNWEKLYQGEDILSSYQDVIGSFALLEGDECFKVIDKIVASKTKRIKIVEAKTKNAAVVNMKIDFLEAEIKKELQAAIARTMKKDKIVGDKSEAVLAKMKKEDKRLEAALAEVKIDEEVVKEANKLGKEACIDNIESALKAGYYTYIRDVFNTNKHRGPLRSACFYFLRDYCFSSMFRYNSKGDFNVPYGGVSYNGRSPATRLSYWKSKDLLDHLNNTTFETSDFEKFLDKHVPAKDDFIFLDPPYDSEFSTYDEQEFGREEQRRLANYVINKTESQFLAVMKNTDFIFDLYKGHENKNVHCELVDKDYTVSFRNRNDKSVKHLVVYRVNKVVETNNESI